MIAGKEFLSEEMAAKQKQKIHCHKPSLNTRHQNQSED